ncbi:hypothetical protein ACFT7U_21075 [Streptomyces rochei]|uniref:hypothetical protein n=1 Tax=Streptomyces rochei TaxID=1928 RepID=UPI003633609C
MKTQAELAAQWRRWNRADYQGGASDAYQVAVTRDSQLTAAERSALSSPVLDGFFPGVLVRDHAAIMNGAEAFHIFRDWFASQGISRRAFYAAMEQRGVTRKRREKGMVLVGVRRAAGEKSANLAIT